jgi:adenosine deaminase
MDWNKFPKVELHLHLDCSLSYEVVTQIDPSITLEDYRKNFVAPAKCTNLVDFLNRVPSSQALLQTDERLRLATLDLFEQLRREHVIYAEIRFAPLRHTEGGLSAHDVVAVVEQATAEGVRSTGVEARLILCDLRPFSEAQSLETVHLVDRFQGSYVTGLDLASDESIPIGAHVAAFQYAHYKGIPCTAHTGEARGPEGVWETLNYLKPSRLGHGVRSLEDPELVDYLLEHQIHLEVCPSSNVQTDVYETYADHPIDALYRDGVSVSVNTDTRGIGNITLSEEYAKLHQTFGWDTEQFFQCNKNALNAAFVPEDVRQKLVERLAAGY